jgi:hypothetical protein
MPRGSFQRQTKAVIIHDQRRGKVEEGEKSHYNRLGFDYFTEEKRTS